MINNIVNKYTYRIEWSEEDQVFIARCLEFPGLAAHGDTTENALKEIKLVIKESIKWLEREDTKSSQRLPPIGSHKLRRASAGESRRV